MATAKETMNAIKKANPQTAVQKTQPASIKDWIEVMKPQIAKALPSVITPERFTRIAMTAVSTNPELAKCTPRSFVGALMNAAQLGLEPNTPLGQAYLIPFRNGKTGTVDCQFQIGYKGQIDLAHRSGEFLTIYAETVFENDEFEYELGLEPKLVHKPAMSDRGRAIFYYAVYKLKNGGYGFEVMSKDDVQAHRKQFSKARFSPWDTNFDEMAKKTVIKKLLKYAPIKTEFARGLATDGHTMDFNENAGEDEMVIIDTTDYSVEEQEQEAENE